MGPSKSIKKDSFSQYLLFTSISNIFNSSKIFLFSSFPTMESRLREFPSVLSRMKDESPKTITRSSSEGVLKHELSILCIRIVKVELVESSILSVANVGICAWQAKLTSSAVKIEKAFNTLRLSMVSYSVIL